MSSFCNGVDTFLSIFFALLNLSYSFIFSVVIFLNAESLHKLLIEDWNNLFGAVRL